MKGYKDITGQRFGRLVALEIRPEKRKKTRWLCECDCGSLKEIPLDSLTSGRGRSCGCLRKENTRRMAETHGMTNERIYKTWQNMKKRCENPEAASYERYGGRGIKVCEEWQEFEPFYKWALENGYTDELTIDRKNNDGDYEPSNCRWVDLEEQANNTSKNVFVKVNGELLTLSQVARKYNINYYTVHFRYSNGARGADLIKPLKKKQLLVTFEGKTLTLKEWSRKLGFSYKTLQHRYSKGLRGNDLFKPVDPVQSAKAKKSRRMA